MLSDLEQNLRDCTSVRAADPVFLALAETVARFGLPITLFLDLVAAFKIDVEKRRYANWAELMTYCSLSANPVGRIMLQLFGYDGDEKLRASDATCTALQLTNFWQDLSIDIKRNRIYLPLEDMDKFNCTEEDVLQQRTSKPFRSLMQYEVEKTALLFEEGRPLLNSVGGGLRFQLKLTWLGGMRILKKIRRSNYDVFRQRPTISGWDKCYLIAQATGRIREGKASKRLGINSIHQEV
jgi:phytoene synthase